MKTIQSNFVVKGRKVGNDYFIVKNNEDRYNVYQLFCDENKDTQVSDIKGILPAFKHLPDEEIIVSIPNEQNHAFLFIYNVGVHEMNRFRITLEDEKMLITN